MPSEHSAIALEKSINSEAEISGSNLKFGSSLISWDYECKVMFNLPLLAKKIDINISKILPKVLDLVNLG